MPDPTTLTTEQLRREIAWTREITDQKFQAFKETFDRFHEQLSTRTGEITAAIDGQQAVVDQRFIAVRELSVERMGSISREIVLNREQTDEKFEETEHRVRDRAEANERAIGAALTSITRELALNRDQTDEKFKEVELRFHERDLRFSQAGDANERAIQAALASLNLLQQRIETQFGKQIDQISSTLVLTNTNLTQRLDDLKNFRVEHRRDQARRGRHDRMGDWRAWRRRRSRCRRARSRTFLTLKG